MKRVKEASLVLMSTLLLLLVLEASVRWLAPQQIDTDMVEGRSLAVKDTLLGHANRPGAVALQRGPEFTASYIVNAQGLRDRAVEGRPRQAEARRILLLGDSFTFGIGSDYDAIWPTIFEQTLKTKGHHVEVINAGVPGYDTRSELQFLKHKWAALTPDLVVLVLLPHDLFTNTPLLPADTTSVTPDVIVTGDDKVPMLHVVTLLQRMVLQNDWLYNQVYRNTGRARFFTTMPDEAVQQQYQTTEALLRRIQDFCRERGLPFVVFTVPQQFQVLAEANRYDAGSVDVRAVDRAVAQVASEAGYPFLAALDTLVQAYRRDRAPLYYRFDGHLTPRGNRVVGQYFAEHFQQMMGSR